MNLLKKIKWENGASTALYYIVIIWVIAIMFVFFVAMICMFTGASEGQLYSDVLSDGTAFIGNNGWGLDTDVADEAFAKLSKINQSDTALKTFDNIAYDTVAYSSTDAYGNPQTNNASSSAYWSEVGGDLNTVNVTSASGNTILTTDNKWATNNKSSTRITYSGGMRIVYEAWLHTYQYLNPKGMADAQTQYVWGGGHGSGAAGEDTGWEAQADCSGFVSGVYRKCGYDVPSWACTWNMQLMGKEIYEGSYTASAFDNAMPGDIILYWWSNGSGLSQHVAIYAGEYKGTHYQVHCSGGSANTSTNPKYGVDGGAILTPVSTGAAKIMIRRIVDSDATAYETPVVEFEGMTEDETTAALQLATLGYSKTAICAILGNLYCEGGGHANQVQTGKVTVDSEEYTWKVEHGVISRDEFANNGPNGGGYGMAQWTYFTRKYGLYDYCLENTNGDYPDIDNAYLQTNWLNIELHTSDFLDVLTELRLSNDVEASTRIFYLKYEMPDLTKDKSFPNRLNHAKEIETQLDKYPELFG